MYMKKFVSLFTAAITALVLLVACKPAAPTAKDAVKLSAVEPTAVAGLLAADQLDYALTAEPSVTALTSKAGSEIKRVFDLSAAFDGGFPQAVLLVKKSVAADTELIDSLLDALTSAAAWVPDHGAEAVAAITAHLEEGTQTTLTAATLTKAAIEGCHISVQTAADAKESVKSYLSDVRAVDADAAKDVTDDFFYAPAAQTSSAGSGLKVYMPDGAPALAFAQLMSENNDLGCEMSYTVVSANNIGPTVATGKADIALLPVTAASLLAGNGDKYQLVSVNTHGNLFLVGKNAPEDFTLASLAGKRVGSIQLASVPGLTLRVALARAGVDYTLA